MHKTIFAETPYIFENKKCNLQSKSSTDIFFSPEFFKYVFSGETECISVFIFYTCFTWVQETSSMVSTFFIENEFIK